MNKIKFAKVIRVIFIPPVLVTLLLLILYFGKRVDFNSAFTLIMSILGLGIFPVLAYPIIYFLPNRKNIREEQRNLSFVLSVIGYAGITLYGLLVPVSISLLVIYFTYLLSVLILAAVNKFFKFRASGHATSIAGPICALIYFKVYIYLPIFILAYVLILYSSVLLKRHTVKEFLLASIIPVVSLIISILVLV